LNAIVVVLFLKALLTHISMRLEGPSAAAISIHQSTMTRFRSQPTPQTVLTSTGRSWSALEADFMRVPAGQVHAPAGDLHGVGLHFGPPVNADCRCGDRHMWRVQKPGDIDIVPAGIDGTWEDDGACWILRLGVKPSLLHQVAEDLGRDPGKIELLPRLQFRDPRLEAIGWAVKAELEAVTPSEPLFMDLLANALAVRLIETTGEASPRTENDGKPKLSARQLRVLTEFIESNLDQKLYLADLAKVAGVSATRLKTLFRNCMGVSVHQYVIRRRVEYARALMATTGMPASEVAIAAGFAHQSHMASTMRRLIGLTPRDIVRYVN
jgi:AraC family transcriptional regulator